jgi:hypothetical protein
MELGIIIAITGTGIAVVGAVLSMMLGARGESNELPEEAKKDRRDFLEMVRSIEHSVNEMKLENKDFHYRLLEIERSRVKIERTI